MGTAGGRSREYTYHRVPASTPNLSKPNGEATWGHGNGGPYEATRSATRGPRWTMRGLRCAANLGGNKELECFNDVAS